MRSCLYRRRDSSGSESERLLPAIPAPGTSGFYDDGFNTTNNGTMGDIGISQSELVQPRAEGRKLPQYVAALAATLGALATGSVLGWSSPVNYAISNSNSTAFEFDISKTQSDWISSLINLGAASVCFFIGFVMDKFGRKTTMLFLVIPFTVGWLCIAFARNVAMLMVGRFITGFAGGAFAVTAPTYTSEIAEPSIRGTLGSFFQLMITVGILFSYVVGSYTPLFVFNIICTFLPLIFGAVFFFMPESPNYLVINGKSEQAREALARLRGRNYDVDHELNILKEKHEEAKRNPVSFVSAIKQKPAIKALILCYALMFFQQYSGINAVLFNTTTIFSDAGASLSPQISAIIIGIIQVIATLVSSLTVDKLGRRILLLFSALVMCICATALGVFFFLKDAHGSDSDIVKAITWLPLASLSVYIIAFSLGFGPIPWLMAGELCMNDIKAFVSSTAGTLNWLLAFLVTSTFNTMNTKMGSGQVFWFFAGIMLFCFVFIFFAVPETKGKSIDEVQVMLGGEPVPKKNDSDNKI